MELILILLAVAGTVGGFLAGRRERASRRSAVAAQARAASIAAAKERGSDRARQPWTGAAQVRWSDMPPRVGIVPAPDGAVYRETPTEVLEPIRTAEQIMADFPPPPEIPSWREAAEPVRVPEPGEPEAETVAESSPLYEQIRETVPVTELDAELLKAGVLDDPMPLDWGALHDVEETPVEDVPQDETRVTGLHRDDEGPPSGPLDDTADGPRVDETAPLAVVAAYRHDWSHARQRPVGPLHWGRGLMHAAVDEVRARIYFAPRVWVTHIRPAAVGPLARIRAAAADWWAAVGPDRSQTWRDGELHRVMGGGISADVHAIRRHRRGGGTWAVVA